MKLISWLKNLFARLLVISGEDIGLANPDAMMMVSSVWESLRYQREKAKKSGRTWWKPDNNVYQFIVGYMARSPKSRHVDALGGVIYMKREAGAHPTMPDISSELYEFRGDSI